MNEPVQFNKTKKKIQLSTECGRAFEIDLHEIIDNRSKYYDKIDAETSYIEEYLYAQGDEDEAYDWLLNNMNWYECATLKELKTTESKLSDLQIEDHSIYEGD